MSLNRKASVGLALAISLATLSSQAKANFEIINFGGDTGSLASYSTATKQLTIANQAITIASPTFAGASVGSGFTLSTVLQLKNNGVTGSATQWQVDVLAGSFTIQDSLSNTVLSGNFSGGILSRFGGNVLFGTNPADAVSYNNDPQAQAFSNFYYGGLYPLVGNFNLSFSSLSPLPTKVGSNLGQDWTGQLSGNADAINAVPEPGEWAAMGILATGLTGLMVKARRRRA